jgi:uncharacterized glyoxalase superfamily protein PhnB
LSAGFKDWKVQNIDDWYNQVKGSVDIIGEMRATFYGKKEFMVNDLNGYFLTSQKI